MKTVINLLISILLNISLAAAEDSAPIKTITCGFGQCAPSFTANLYLEQSARTIIDVGSQNNATIQAVLPENQDPRNLVLSVNNNSIIGQDIVINLNSKKVEKHSGNFTLIGDIFKNVSINLDGYNGETGKDASILCADKFKNGNYGEDSKGYFLNRRTSNPNLNPNRCDNQDVQHLQETKFQCQNPGYSLSEFETVNVNRIKFKQRCIGTSIRYKCLQRKVQLKCEWAGLARGTPGPCGKGCHNHCSRIFGAADCFYGNYSCWSSDYNAELPHADSRYSSYPNPDQVPPWSVTSELSRCSPRSEPGSLGGWFAYQRTDLLNEQTYLRAVQSNSVAALCGQFPNPTQKNRSGTPAWKFNRVAQSALTYPGLDPETQNPLPGSNWIVKLSDFFVSCGSYGEFETLNSQIDNWTSFGDIGNSCSDARIPEDTNNLIPWTKAGEEQDPSFGTERLNCSPGNCPIQNLVQENDLNYDVLDPTSGANGTSQGNGNLLVYDFKTITSSANPGIAGNGGQNDIGEIIQDKYCVKIDDANTQGILSSFAKSPLVNFNIYKWQALNVKRGQPSGGSPEFSKNKINIFKKLDSSIRYLIKQETL